MSDARETLLTTLAENADVARLSPSPFYARLLELMADDVRAGGPAWTLLEPYATEPATEYFPFRALAGVHYEVLAGERPPLAAHFASTGGDGDADAAWPLVRELLAGQDPELLAEFSHPLQTNETSRCGALIGGFSTVAATTGLPLRVLELGASAGLNLHFDRYRYEQDGLALGPPASPIVFRDYWEGGTPPLDAPLRVVERAGCDLSPLDPAVRGRLPGPAVLRVARRGPAPVGPARGAVDRPRAPGPRRHRERRHVGRSPAAGPARGLRHRGLPLGLLDLRARPRA